LIGLARAASAAALNERRGTVTGKNVVASAVDEE
jgi:hypothetical protein